MFVVPVDALYAWLGVATVSIAVLGVVVALPTTAPPDPTTAADAVDRVTVGPPDAHDTARIDAAEYRLGPHQLSLRNDGGAASATFAYGPVTPVLDDDRLELLLYGHAPATVFETRAAFRRAIDAAQSRSEWRTAPKEIEIRRVQWGETSVTLVG
jgi:hypothetical protein